ncbi:MAG: isoprenyl transferase [Bacteroidia bacterium]
MKTQLNPEKLPSHIAIIMDGNGRWAKGKGKLRIFGHHNGVKSVREVTEASAELGIKYLTLYAFSTENWNRPKLEIDALMELLVATINRETKTLMENNIKLATIGDTDSLPQRCRKELLEAIKTTSTNTGMTLVLALSYSARWDLVQAVKKITKQVEAGKIKPDDINDAIVSTHLTTADFPEPELLIRTSGEERLSNFLLWELAYSELYFTDTLWPDFRKEDLYKAILNYQQRERRFGKTSEQLNKT